MARVTPLPLVMALQTWRMAQAADVVFARDLLAGLLTERGLAFHPWHDFDDVVRLLAQLGLVSPTAIRS